MGTAATAALRVLLPEFSAVFRVFFGTSGIDIAHKKWAQLTPPQMCFFLVKEKNEDCNGTGNYVYVVSLNTRIALLHAWNQQLHT